MIRKANLFVVGAPKCGTTSLFYILTQHPDIFFPNPKELNFFQSDIGIRNSKYYNDIRIKSLNEYEKIYKGRTEKFLGDGSVSYFADPNSPTLIKEYNPDAKIIICVRNPVDRAFSHYLMDKALGLVGSNDFSKIIHGKNSSQENLRYQYLENGLFNKLTDRWNNKMSSENVLVLHISELSQVQGINRVFDFLKIPIIDISFRDANSYKEYRSYLARKLGQQRHLISKVKKLVNYSNAKWIKGFLYKEVEKPQIKLEDKAFLSSFYDKDIKWVSQLKTRLNQMLNDKN